MEKTFETEYKELHPLHSKLDPFKMYVVHWASITMLGRHFRMFETVFKVYSVAQDEQM